MNLPSRLHVGVTALGVLVLVATAGRDARAGEPPCPHEVPAAVYLVETPAQPSWIFRRGPYTHDPSTGARVAQYLPPPPVEPLDDPRLVTSRYGRSRTMLRGDRGSVDTVYEVQSWSGSPGGLDAEWERFHDAWKDSFLSGGFYHQGPFVAPGFAPGFPHRAPAPHALPHHALPHQGFPGHALPHQGFPGHALPHHGFHPSHAFPPGHPGHRKHKHKHDKHE